MFNLTHLNFLSAMVGWLVFVNVTVACVAAELVNSWGFLRQSSYMPEDQTEFFDFVPQLFSYLRSEGSSTMAFLCP